MENLVTITVDGREMQVAKGTLLWEACQAHGIDIPIFCYHTKLGPVGACRTCLVEQEGVAKGPITACSTPVADGMNIRTRSPIVEKAQRGIFEFLLANHPLDCPICDRAGECPLQDQSFAYGPGSSRYIEPKRHHVKPVAIGPTIALDRERCVLCWRCVRFCAEIAEDKSIVLQDRGDHSKVGTFQGEPYVSNFSGNVIELCPVGALTSRKQRFNFRPWELSNRPSVCPHCPVGCNINVSVRKNDEVIRFLSRDNPAVDDSWLCDKGRFNFEFINSPERLASPLIRRPEGFQEVSWDEAFQHIADRLAPILEESGPSSVAGVATARLTNEDLFVFKRFMSTVIGSMRLDHYPRPDIVLTSEHAEAARALDNHLMSIAELEDAKTIILLGANPSVREPVLELRIRKAVNKFGAKLVVVTPEEISLSSKAHSSFVYPVERFADVARTLAGALDRSGVATPPTGEVDGPVLVNAVTDHLEDGRVAVLYDDTFEGVVDKGDALVALSAFVSALEATREVGVLPMLDVCNSMGARDLGIVPGSEVWGAPVVTDLLAAGTGIRAAFLIGANLSAANSDRPAADALSRLDFLVVSELFLTETARHADVILPAASFAEKEGTFTNTERRLQALRPAVPSPGVSRPDWQILVDLSQYFEQPLEYSSLEDIWRDLRHEVPVYADVEYGRIGSRGARPRALAAV